VCVIWTGRRPFQPRHVRLSNSRKALTTSDWSDWVVQELLAGSTALLATFCGGGPTELTVHVANVGDCRALLCRGGKAMRLSEDHKPNRRDERARIVKAGGLVTQVIDRPHLTLARRNLRAALG
jgi:serine/threonine protein phosphatase PrpC